MCKCMNFIVFGLLLSSCALDFREYEEEMDPQNDDILFHPGVGFRTVSGDPQLQELRGVWGRIPPSAESSVRAKNEYELEQELTQLEESLSDREYTQYSRIMSYFDDKSEQIFFLNLTPLEKRSYLELKGLRSPSPARAPASIIDPRQLETSPEDPFKELFSWQ